MAGIQEPQAEGDGVKSVQWSDADSDTMELVLVNSGVYDYICHPDFVKESPLKKSVKLTLRCARQSIVSPWHTTRQSESGNTGTASEH